jgi:hypothetical protein
MAAEQVVDVNLTNFLVVFLMIIIVQALFAGGWLAYETWTASHKGG